MSALYAMIDAPDRLYGNGSRKAFLLEPISTSYQPRGGTREGAPAL